MSREVDRTAGLQARVREWMRYVGQEVHETPTVPREESARRSLKLVVEEVLELVSAMGYSLRLRSGQLELVKRKTSSDLVEVFDALCDLIYVIHGVANTFGLPLQEGMREVVRSNDTKLQGGYARKDGKWLKGPGYKPPQLKPLLEQALKTTVPGKNPRQK